MEQIAGVVQANSAALQQSAASAQEMHAQADLLNRTVGRFRLREAEGALTVAKQAPAPPKAN